MNTQSHTYNIDQSQIATHAQRHTLTARAGNLTMWDVGFWIVVAGSQDKHSAGDSGFLIKIRLHIYLQQQGLKHPKHIYKTTKDLNPKIIDTYTRVIQTPNKETYTEQN